MPKIDETQYQAGRAWCAAGNSLRSVIERVVGTMHDEAAAMSFALGFADEVLDQFRGMKGS